MKSTFNNHNLQKFGLLLIYLFPLSLVIGPLVSELIILLVLIILIGTSLDQLKPMNQSLQVLAFLILNTLFQERVVLLIGSPLKVIL